MKLQFYRKVRGSLASPANRGDGILCTTMTVSSNIDEWENWIIMGNLSKWYASLLLLYNPKSGLYNVVHCQGEHVSFTDRKYATRAAYELSVEEMEKIGFSYSSLIESLPRMKKYEKKESGIDAAVEVKLLPKRELDGEEKNLYNALCASIILDRQVVILQGSDYLPPFKENGLLEHPLMKHICAVVDALPVGLRKYMSVAMSVDDNYAKVSDMFQILCCQEGSSSIVGSDAIRFTWDGKVLEGNGNYAAYAETIAAISDLIDIKGDFSRHGVNGQVKTISDSLESLFTTSAESLKDSQVRMLENLYKSRRYRYEDVLAKLRDIIVDGMGCRFSIWDDDLYDQKLVSNLLSHKNWLKCFDELSRNVGKYRGKAWFGNVVSLIPKGVEKMTLVQQLERYGNRDFELYGIGAKDLKPAMSWSDASRLGRKVGYTDDIFENLRIGKWTDYDNLTDELWSKLRKYVEKDIEGYRDLRRKLLPEYFEKGKWSFLYKGELTTREIDQLFDMYKNPTEDKIFALLEFVSNMKISDADKNKCSGIKEMLKNCRYESLVEYIGIFVKLPNWADVAGSVNNIKEIGADFDSKVADVKNDRHKNVLLERKRELLVAQKPRDFETFVRKLEDGDAVLSMVTSQDIKSYIGADCSRYAKLLSIGQNKNLPELDKAIEDFSLMLKERLLDRPEDYCKNLNGLNGRDKKNVVKKVNLCLDKTKPLEKKPNLYDVIYNNNDVKKILKPHRESIDKLFINSGFEVKQESGSITDMMSNLVSKKIGIPIWTTVLFIICIVALIVIVSIQGVRLGNIASNDDQNILGDSIQEPTPKVDKSYVLAYDKESISNGEEIQRSWTFENVQDVISYMRERFNDDMSDSLYYSQSFDSICVYGQVDTVIRFVANKSFLLELIRLSNKEDTKSDSLLYVLKKKIDENEKRIDTISRISTYINDTFCLDSIQVDRVLYVRVSNGTIDTIQFDVKTNNFNNKHKSKMYGINSDRYCLWLMEQIDSEYRKLGVDSITNYNF